MSTGCVIVIPQLILILSRYGISCLLGLLNPICYRDTDFMVTFAGVLGVITYRTLLVLPQGIDIIETVPILW